MESISTYSKKTLIVNDKELGYSRSSMGKYWCYLCKKVFSQIYIPHIDIQCNYCGNTFCEKLENSSPNSEHNLPFSIRNNNNNNNNSNNSSNHILFSQGDQQPQRPDWLLNQMINFSIIQNYNRNIEQIINQLLINDNSNHGNPPASKSAVDKLVKCKITEKKLREFGFENSCPICKDEFIINEECLLMPCEHHFHNNCLIPWLKQRNSCPVCRYELPTDDEDFEKRKQERINNNNNNNNNH